MRLIHINIYAQHIFKLHVNLIISHVDIILLHVNIDMLHVIT